MNLPSVEPLALHGVLAITPARFSDARGYFCESYNRVAFREIGIDCEFMQENHALSLHRGTIRGLHFQIAPCAQAKLVRVLRGTIFDVVVDLRRKSVTYGNAISITLDAENGRQLFVPAGMAHGYCTLEENTEVAYRIDAPYSREHERGLLWNDPALGIAWPVDEDSAILIDRDSQFPPLHGLPGFF